MVKMKMKVVCLVVVLAMGFAMTEAYDVLVRSKGEVKLWSFAEALFSPPIDLADYVDDDHEYDDALAEETAERHHDVEVDAQDEGTEPLVLYDDDDDDDQSLLVDEECFEYEVRVEVYFGLDVKCGNGLNGVATQIADREFEAFLDSEVTPRFPQGFSVMDVPLGQWYSPARHAVTKERSKVMLLLMPDTRENDRKLRAIAHSYTTRFRQETVMISKSPLFSYCFVGAAQDNNNKNNNKDEGDLRAIAR